MPILERFNSVDLKLIFTWFLRPQRLRFARTGVCGKWQFSAPQTVLWLIKVWFSASTFVVKIATFAKPQTVSSNAMTTNLNNIEKSKMYNIDFNSITNIYVVCDKQKYDYKN